MTAAVLAGGEVSATPRLRRMLGGAGLVVAADSGLRHAAPLGLYPDLIVGDFDSVAAEVLERYPQVPRLRHPPDKDWLDLELALDEARVRGAGSAVVAGALGDRFDQSLAAVLIAARHKEEGFDVRLDSGDRQLWFLAGAERLTLELDAGCRFSVLSLAGASVVTIRGAKFPLSEHPLGFGLGLGVSNEVVAAPLIIEQAEGLAAVIVE